MRVYLTVFILVAACIIHADAAICNNGLMYGLSLSVIFFCGVTLGEIK